ncbi:MAG: methyltransferase domain-containing protein [Anaerolineae bacterium]|nr:methyltransferase domain-containing protein [Anaerolineae bacterium]
MTEDTVGESPEGTVPYAHGCESQMTLKHHATRTAATYAAFFLPYLREGMSLLDCGCGSGSITVGLAAAEAPGQAIGIDISDVEIARARNRAAEQGVRNLDLRVGGVTHLPFPDESFDAVFSHNVLEHLRDPLGALEEMRRVLAPGGVLGIRDRAPGGRLMEPRDELVEAFNVVYEADWCEAAGHARTGRRLPGLMRQAGPADIVTTAPYELYTTPDQLRSVAEIFATRCAEPDFCQRVLGRGLVSADRLTAIQEAWCAWPERLGAFGANAYVEVVGWKAPVRPGPEAS